MRLAGLVASVLAALDSPRRVPTMGTDGTAAFFARRRQARAG